MKPGDTVPKALCANKETWLSELPIPILIRNRCPSPISKKLNPEQRRAVEHGVQENACAPAMPLLVIAGAGSARPIRSPIASRT